MSEPGFPTYPATPPDLLPGPSAAGRIVRGFLIAAGFLGVLALGLVVAAIVAVWFLFHAGAAEAHQSEHNSVLLFSAFTGQAPETSYGGGGSRGSEGRAFGPLQGHPTPRQAMTKAMAAFAATGWTPMAGSASGEQWCSLDPDGRNAYLPGDATATIRVTCSWRAYRATSSTASIAIDVSLPAADLQPTFDSRGDLEANASIMDLPLYNGVLVASASK